MRISTVKPASWLAVNLHHLFSDGAAVNTQSRSSLTSYAILRSESKAIRLRLQTRYIINISMFFMLQIPSKPPTLHKSLQ